jgi:basic membrane lipoprotein Med (substrate-binding protein (PBP1-ABC) superfamily)
MEKGRRSTRRLAAAVIAAASLIAACGNDDGSSAPKLIVAGVHVGSINDAGYNEAQHDGLTYLKEHLDGVEVIEAENVPEGPDVERVLENMIGQGATLVFPQSFGYQEFALNVAANHSDVTFEHPAGYMSAENFGTYWAASDQLHYALGVAAGSMTESGKIGFVGSIPIPQVIASVNAFHLGARSVNPDVTTTVIFTGSWLDPGKEAAATNTMADQGVDVVASLVDSPITVTQTAEQRHMYAIGYHSAAAAEFAPNYWLSGIDFNWGPMFVEMAQAVMDGTWAPQNNIAPLAADVARLAPYGPNVPSDVQAAIDDVVSEFKDGTRTSAFVGPVYDQSGELRIEPGAVPDDDFRNNVDWFAEGIIGQPS